MTTNQMNGRSAGPGVERKHGRWFWPVLLLAPLAMAPRGCEPQRCGGLQGQPCPAGQYCDYPPEALCGAADQMGVCQAVPDVCTDIYDPVCGCDGKTYGNACEAAAAQVSIVAEGECAPSTAVCGGLQGAPCPDGQYCNFPAEMACGFADGTGSCEAIPEQCTQELAPVCGCDGTTYPNACFAAAAGVSVRGDGECN